MSTIKLIILSTTFLLLSTSLSASAEFSEDGRYITGEGITLYCDAEPHPLVPQGGPQDHDSLERWLFSGQPECAFSDVWNTLEDDARPNGYAGYAWVWDDHRTFPAGDTFTVTTIDDTFGTGSSYVRVYQHTFDEKVYAEGCGPQALELQPPEDQWYWEPRPVAIWVEIPPIGVDADLTTCLASKGLVQGEWTPA